MNYVVINLARSPERRKHMEDQLAQAGVLGQAEFFPAIDGKQLAAGKESGGYRPSEVRRLSRWVPYLRHKGFLWTQAAAFLSHRAVWQQLAESTDHDFYVVLEDDSYLHPDFAAIIDALIEKPDRDLVRLYATQYVSVQAKALCALPARHKLVMEYGPHPQGKLMGKDALHTTAMIRNWLFGAVAYLLSRRGAAHLLSSAASLRRPVDDHMQRFWQHDLPPLVVNPHPVRINEAENFSTIGMAPESPYQNKDLYAVLPFYSASPRNLACRTAQTILRRRDALRYRRYIGGLMGKWGAPDLVTQPPTPAPFSEK